MNDPSAHPRDRHDAFDGSHVDGSHLDGSGPAKGALQGTGASSYSAGLLGPLQYEVLQTLWFRSPATVTQVRDSVNSKRTEAQQLAYTTVMTILGRLYERGVLNRTKVGRSYRYAATYPEDEFMRRSSAKEVHGLLDRYGAVALSQFASALRDADPDLLRRLVELADGDGPEDDDA